MKLKELVRGYLEAQPLFRERRHKDRGIVNILISRHYKLGEAIRAGIMSKEFVTEMMLEYANMDRYWRQILAEPGNEYLRGRDYADKEQYEQEREIKLGYSPGHSADVKTLGKLRQ